MSHTHVLAKPHKMIDEEGNRRVMPAGTPCSPTERQSKNMPDVFLLKDGQSEPEPSTGHRLKELSIGAIKDLVGGIDDIEELDTMLAEEEHGRNRKGAIKAIEDRIDVLAEDGEE
jgi:hypothetical protein